jgi:hypothetical protein
VRKLTGALVQQLLPTDEVKHNPMKTRESAKTAAAAAATPNRPTDSSSKSQPEGEKKRANHGRGVLVASL